MLLSTINKMRTTAAPAVKLANGATATSTTAKPITLANGPAATKPVAGSTIVASNQRSSNAVGQQENNDRLLKLATAQQPIVEQMGQHLADITGTINTLQSKFQPDPNSPGSNMFTGTSDELAQLNDLQAQQKAVQGSMDAHARLIQGISSSQGAYLPANVSATQAAAVPPTGGNIEQLRNLRLAGQEGGVDAQGNVIDKGAGVLAGTGAAAPVATPQQITQNATNLKGIMDHLSPTERVQAQTLTKQISDLRKPLNQVEDTSLNDPALTLQIETQRAEQASALEEQLTQLQTRAAQKKKDAMAAGAGFGTTPGQDATSTATTASQATPGATPPIPGAPLPSSAPVDPNAPVQIDPTTGVPVVPGQNPGDATGADGTINSIKSNAAQALTDRLGNINAPLPGALDPADANAVAKDNYSSQLDAATEQAKVDADKALEKERNDLAVNDRAAQLAQIENTKSQLDQIKLNTDNEVKNRRAINKLTGGSDMSGLQYVQKAVQNGLDQLNYLRSKAANMDQGFGDTAIGIINTYGNDLAQAEATKKTTYAADYSSYLTRLDDIRKELKADSTDKMKMRDAAHKDYADTLTQADFKYGDWLNQIHLKAIDRMTGLEKLQMQLQQQQVGSAIKMMALTTKKGIAMTPAAMANFEHTVAPNLPPGWFSKSAAGTGGGAGANYKVWQGPGLQAAMAWVQAQPGRSMTQLSPADQQWLVPFYQGGVPGSPQAGNANLSKGTPQPTSRGGQLLAPGQTAPEPANPFSFETPKADTMTSDQKNYAALLKSTGKSEASYPFGQFLKDKAMYYTSQTFPTGAPSGPSATAVQAAADNAQQTVNVTQDTTVDDIINSDTYNFDN